MHSWLTLVNSLSLLELFQREVQCKLAAAAHEDCQACNEVNVTIVDVHLIGIV